MAAFEVQQSTTNHLETTESCLNQQPLDNVVEGEVMSGPETSTVNEGPKWQRNEGGFAFEQVLMSSRAYRRAATNRNSDAFSVLSSARRTASWSTLSGLSISEVSHIGILAIPVYASDITTNKDQYEFSPNLNGSTNAHNLASFQGVVPTFPESNQRGWLNSENFL